MAKFGFSFRDSHYIGGVAAACHPCLVRIIFSYNFFGGIPCSCYSPDSCAGHRIANNKRLKVIQSLESIVTP
jgi:hypothetical protein